MIQSKQLKLVPDPPVKTFQSTAFCLSLLMNDPQYIHEFYNSFINLHWYGVERGMCIVDNVLFHRNNALYEVKQQKLDYFEQYGQIEHKSFVLNAIKSGIENDYYVIGSYDEYHINIKRPYRKYHYVHDFDVFGFDDNKQYFNMVGLDRNFQYRYFDISYDDLYAAISRYESESEYQELLRCGTLLYMIKVKPNLKFCFSPERVKNEIIAFVSSTATDNEPVAVVSGVDVFDKIIESTTSETFDRRSYHLLGEHADIMYNRLVKVGAGATTARSFSHTAPE